MLTPEVAQLIAEERIAERIRYAQTAHLIRLARGDRPSRWARLAEHLRGTLSRLPSVLRRRQAPSVSC
jgi:hypothetical protein